MRPIVITGCQRSGTAYIASLITACGYWCSHERLFRDGRYQELKPESIESSWAAAGYADRFTTPPHLVHQVRHPLSVIASCLARGTFRGKLRPSARWASEIYPGIFQPEDSEIIRILRYWVEWNTLTEWASPDVRWRIEYLNAEELADILTGFGRPVTAERVAQAQKMIPIANAATSDVDPVTWDDLPVCKLTRRAMTMARRYGYEL